MEIVRSTSARAVTPRLDKVFAEFGIPEVVRSDNGDSMEKSSGSSLKHLVLSTEKSPLFGHAQTAKLSD